MIKNLKCLIILVLLLTVIFPNSFAAGNSDKTLNKAKKEANAAVAKNNFYLKSSTIDLLKKAVAEGSGEAAFILFSYYELGSYNGKQLPALYPSTSGYRYSKEFKQNVPKPVSFIATDPETESGIPYLKLAADYNYPEAFEFRELLETVGQNDPGKLLSFFLILQEANHSAGSKAQLLCAKMWRFLNNENRYLYWLHRALDRNNPELDAQVEFANYLLDTGQSEEAYKIITDVEKKLDYKWLRTRSRGLEKIDLFHIADCLYKGQTDEAIERCNVLITNDKTGLERFTEDLSGISTVEYVINYFELPYRNNLFRQLHSLNQNPEPEILYNRGLLFESRNDSVAALNNYVNASVEGHSRAITKSFDFFNRGVKYAAEDLGAFIESVKNPGMKIEWRSAFVMGTFFYDNQEFRDDAFAVKCFQNCFDNIRGVSYEYTDMIKGECARYLFKCYTFGRGVEANQDKADKWLRISQKHGDTDADLIHQILYSQGESADSEI